MTLTDTKPDIKVGDQFVATFGVEITEAAESDDGSTGHVEALVSVYDVAYRMGFGMKHQIAQGAFTASIAENPVVPIFWQHNWAWSEQPPIGTGAASEVAGAKPGVKVAADLFLDTDSGKAVFRANKAKALREWSIGYRVTEYTIEEHDDGTQTAHITGAEMFEASSVLKGANPETETLKVASEENLLATLEAATEALELATTQLDLQTSINQALLDAKASMQETIDALTDRIAALEERPQVSADEPGGEEEQVEPPVGTDGEGAPEAASDAPRVPGFLPPASDQGEPSDSVESVTRVMRAWGRVERDAEVRSLIQRHAG